MGYEKKIEIYKIIQEFNTPLASNPNQLANSGNGNHVVIIEEEVWIADFNNRREEQFAKAIYSPEFVRKNGVLFEKIS